MRAQLAGQAEPDPATVVHVALLLLRDVSGALLLNLRAADASAEPGQWSLPGGHVEEGEAPVRAAVREQLGRAADPPQGTTSSALCLVPLRPRQGSG
jgi:hypothetical protein